jgi:hypothetical protein
MAGFLVLLAAAIVVNAFTDVHTTHRSRLDKKVAARWFKSHPQLGKFGPPVVKIHQRQDIVCAARHAQAGVKNASDGYCVWIVDANDTSTAIAKSHRCVIVRPGVVRPRGTPACPKAHQGPQ